MRDMEGVGRRVTNKIADMKEDIEYRNKLILIADSPESTWDTVQEYKKRDLADDSDDEKKLRMAENRAKRMRLARPGQGASRFRPRAPSTTVVGPQQIFTNNTSQPIAIPLMPNVQQATFRPPTAFGSAPFLQANQVRHPVPRDICLTCGESGTRRAPRPSHRSSPEPQSKPRKDDPNYVRNLQLPRFLCCYPGCPLPVRLRSYYRYRSCLRRWCHPHCPHL